jgi:hypothetical protein
MFLGSSINDATVFEAETSNRVDITIGTKRLDYTISGKFLRKKNVTYMGDVFKFQF